MAGLTYHRKNIPPEFADTSQWPACDTDGWSQEEQERYTTYHSAICDYLQFKSLSKLKKEYGLTSAAIRRQLNRCLTIWAPGEVLGWRALTPNLRVGTYQRQTKPRKHSRNGGLTGALTFLLKSMPAEFEMGLVAYIKADTVTLKRMAREGKVPAIVREKGAAKQGTFVYFKALCEHFGVARDEWPYTTSSQGYNAIRDFRLKVLSSAFRAEAGMTGGEDAATRSKVGTGVPRLFSAPIAYCAWQLDAHRLDAVGFIEIPLPNGKMVRAALERSWVIAVTDTHSTVVVGFIFCYGAEANSDDLQQLLHLCLRKWNRIPIPEELIHLRYGCLICMPGEDPRLEALLNFKWVAQREG